MFIQIFLTYLLQCVCNISFENDFILTKRKKKLTIIHNINIII